MIIKNNVPLDKNGKVYFFYDGECVKIGFTTEPLKRRLQRLNTGSSRGLTNLGYITGTISLEEEVQKKFVAYRVRENGEWFTVSQELVDFINDNNEENTAYLMMDDEGKINKFFKLKKVR